MLTADQPEAIAETGAVAERLVPPADTRQRGFWVALWCALVLHSGLIVEANRAAPRTLGDRSGVSDAIAVELVTEADLKSRESVVTPPAGAPPVAASPPPTPPPQSETPPQPQTTPQPEAAAPAPAPPTEAPPQEKKQAALPEFKAELPDFATSLEPEKTPAEAKPAPETKAEPKPEAQKPAEKTPEPAKPAEQKPPTPPKKKQANLDLSRPQDAPPAPAGRSAAFTRPPGITRSGENDAFGIGVIRALKMTMPPPSGTYGTVTVRLLLDENGDLTSVQVLDGSGKSALDQSVVFATKQTNFPLPPLNATIADRTFVIRYVYR